MSFEEWFCRYCGDALDDNCIKIVADDSDTGYCFDCAEMISTAFVNATSAVSGSGPVTPSAHDYRALIDRLDALEDLARRTKNVWVLWLNDAAKGAINPGTFRTMKVMLGMDNP